MSEQEQLPIAIYGNNETYIQIGEDFKIPCYVLDNGKRVLSQRGLTKALGMSTGGGTGGAQRIVQFIGSKSINPFISDDLRVRMESPIKFTLGGKITHGYDAEILQQVVRGASKAYLQGKLLKQQEHIGRNAEILDDAFSKVGLIALIDEATGYQKDVNRAKDELRQLLSKFIREAEGKWVKTFPDEFFEMIFKMKGWTWVGIAKSKKPGVLGHYINDLIYSRLAPAVLDELRRKNPVMDSGKRKSKHHQWLTEDMGNPKLQEHFSGVLALGRASGFQWNIFYRMMEKSYPKFGHTLEILFPDDNILEEPKPKQTGFDKMLKGLLSVPPPKKEK